MMDDPTGACLDQEQLLKMFLDLKEARLHAATAEDEVIEALTRMTGKEPYAANLKHAAGQAHQADLRLRTALMDLLDYRN